MAKLPASLFNDVIGPVMRGPSSSHVAGAARIGALVRQSLGGDVRSVLVEFDVNGSLAESYHGHGSDIGFVSGLLDIDLTDPRVPDACAIAEREGVEVAFSILDYGASHPNQLPHRRDRRRPGAPSIGKPSPWAAAMVEMQRFEGFPVSIDGGYHEYLLLIDAHAAPLEQAAASVKAVASSDELRAESDGARLLINLKRASALDAETVARLRALPGVTGCTALDPILPTRSWGGCSVPFSNAAGSLNTPSRTAGRCGSLPPAMKACAATPPKRTFSTRWIGWSASWKRPSRTGLPGPSTPTASSARRRT